jgi:hypothetical protein
MSNEALWEQWRTWAAGRLDMEAEELEAGGGPSVFDEDQKSIAAQTWRNAANRLRSMPMPPHP